LVSKYVKKKTDIITVKCMSRLPNESSQRSQVVKERKRKRRGLREERKKERKKEKKQGGREGERMKFHYALTLKLLSGNVTVHFHTHFIIN
jgi:hypothetical protein